MIQQLNHHEFSVNPHTILYVINNNIPLIILQILKSGFRSYNPDEFTLHIEYINVLE